MKFTVLIVLVTSAIAKGWPILEEMVRMYDLHPLTCCKMAFPWYIKVLPHPYPLAQNII